MANYWVFFSAFALITIVLAITIRFAEPQQPSKPGASRPGGGTGNPMARRRALRSFAAWLQSADEDKLETLVRSEAWEAEYRAKKRFVRGLAKSLC